MKEIDALAQYQTDPQVAQCCMKFLRSHLPRSASSYYFLEPSAGVGAFYTLLPPRKRLAIDIDPRLRRSHPDYITADFLDVQPGDLPWKPHGTSAVVVVGNPPFSANGTKQNRQRGRAVNLAMYFLNHATQFGDTVAMIVPSGMGKACSKERVTRAFHLVGELDLSETTFAYKKSQKTVYNGCLFQVWQRGQVDRVKTPKRMVRGEWDGGDWRIVHPIDRAANLLVRRWSSQKTLGGVIDDPRAVRAAIAESRQAETRYRADARYGRDYRLSRNSRVDFFLHCTDPRATAAAFRRAKPEFLEYGKYGLPASVTQEDLLIIYLAGRRRKSTKTRAKAARS